MKALKFICAIALNIVGLIVLLVIIAAFIPCLVIQGVLLTFKLTELDSFKKYIDWAKE